MNSEKTGGKKTAAFHDGPLHADDAFAAAVLVLAGEIGMDGIVRTRDKAVLAKADFEVDVGGRHAPPKSRSGKGYFDHHQGAGARPNGVPYAAFGLVWKEYGPGICGGDLELSDHVDRMFVQALDAVDTGFGKHTGDDIPTASVSDAICLLNPAWHEKNGSSDAAFGGAVAMALIILQRQMEHSRGQLLAVAKVRKAVSSSRGKIVALDESCPWQDVVVNESDALYAVFPSRDKTEWNVQCVPLSAGSHETRKPFPASWAGKRDEELANLTGVRDAVFCHIGRFCAAAKSRKGALALARLAVDCDDPESD